MPTSSAPRPRAPARVRLLAALVLLLLSCGCEAIVEHLAERSDPSHAGAHAHTLRATDAYGNEIPAR